MGKLSGKPVTNYYLTKELHDFLRLTLLVLVTEAIQNGMSSIIVTCKAPP